MSTMVNDVKVRLLLAVLFSRLISDGCSHREACRKIHRAMCRLALEHGLPEPVWPHDFPLELEK